MRRKRQRGVTLIEMLLVVALIGLMAGVTFPSVSAGIDSIRIAAASDTVVSFLNGALNRANRRQEVIELEISLTDSTLKMRSARPGFERTVGLPAGVEIRDVLPTIPVERDIPRRIMVYPGGAPPRIGIEIVNRRGAERTIRVDPITGVALIERGKKP